MQSQPLKHVVPRPSGSTHLWLQLAEQVHTCQQGPTANAGAEIKASRLRINTDCRQRFIGFPPWVVDPMSKFPPRLKPDKSRRSANCLVAIGRSGKYRHQSGYVLTRTKGRRANLSDRIDWSQGTVRLTGAAGTTRSPHAWSPAVLRPDGEPLHRPARSRKVSIPSASRAWESRYP